MREMMWGPDMDMPISRLYGVMVGVVTNNQDPDGLGRVKVKLPWMSEEEESHWAWVLTPMAGPSRGLYLLPEVEDTVLVAFEHGLAAFPYVLGALWNGQDKPPASNDDGENNTRSLTSRSGHVIRLDDTEGGEQIEIVDSSGKNSIVISTADNTVTITSDGDLVIEASGKLSLSGQGIDLNSSGGDMSLSGDMNVELKAGPQLNLSGQKVNIN